MKVVAGIDIGGTNIRFGIVNELGKCLGIWNTKTKDYPNYISFVKEVSTRLKRELIEYDLIGVGIGAPNGNFHNGCIENAPNLPWKGIVPLAQLFQDELEVPCILSNDANAAAIGEMLFGGAQYMRDFIFITLGTGLGSGIVSNGQLIYGHDGMAAELGHVIVESGGRRCACGRFGCLETYVSATGIKRTVDEWLKQGEESVLNEYEVIHSANIFEAATNGDELALRAFTYTGEILGLALANSVAYTSPKSIFLFGGLAKAGELIFAPTRYFFERNLFAAYKNKIQIIPSQLEEDQAPILGAASLVLSNK